MGALLVLQLNRGKYFILMNNCTRILFVEDVLSDAILQRSSGSYGYKRV
jgi:hypothetical protein